ncbi:S8 family serine peptidase [Streptacidiphilus sp. EB129]|uniref:S8 family serine peptidase n=1 Tax=Streptacidiphilus sp. EB129 TaxID=3156262 RepID=UPI0035167A94
MFVVLTMQAACADQVRDAQWPLTAFRTQAQVWPQSTGKGVIVAVIDGGVRATHQDLIGQVQGGKDFVHGGNGWHDYDATGHGTAMASLIAGHGHGAQGVEGIKGLAPGATILPLTVAIGSSSALDSQTADAIHYAVEQGAAVINMSYGSAYPDTTERAAIAYAESHNVVLVAGAGNDGLQVDNYPAAYPGVVSVGAADENGAVWSKSDYGHSLVLTAPGVRIVAAGANSDSEYRLSDGTSDATAYVSAAAALLRSKYPNLTAGQIVNRLVKTAIDPNAAAGQTAPDPHFGYGIIRPDAALSSTIPPGPSAGPLPQADASAAAVATAASQHGSSGSGSIGLIAGLAGAVVVLLGGATVLRRRRRRTPPARP